MSVNDAIASQHSAIFDVLVRNCGKTLTPDNVDAIMAEMDDEMRRGSFSWAFKPNVQPDVPAPAADRDETYTGDIKRACAACGSPECVGCYYCDVCSKINQAQRAKHAQHEGI